MPITAISIATAELAYLCHEILFLYGSMPETLIPSFSGLSGVSVISVFSSISSPEYSSGS
ncbi:MAG: hypothetical protein K2J36_07505 [Ruminococcus sp.]|nr:hypothetical protein [Ruminococcus sp.]